MTMGRFNGLLAALLVSVPHMSQAQPAAGEGAFPSRPLRIIVPFHPGGTPDVQIRLMQERLAQRLGQPVVIDNRGGANGIIGMEIAARAAPDGYTVTYATVGAWTVHPFLIKLPYDVLKDFTPVIHTAVTPGVLVVHPSVQAKTVKELIALAKARPGELNYAASPIGSAVHLAAELLNASAGVKVTLIPYKDAAGALNALISGEVQLMFPAAGSAMPLLKANRIRALAVTSARPSTLLPGVPTMAAAGLPGFDVEVLYAILAPAGTPPAIVAALNKAVVQAIQPPATRERFAGAGIEAVGGTPEQLAASIKNEMTTLGAVIRNAGIRLD